MVSRYAVKGQIMKFLMSFLLVSIGGCSESLSDSENESKTEATGSNDAGKPAAKQESYATPEIVSLVNVHSVKRFLEAELDAAFENSSTGFIFENDSIKAEIDSFDGELDWIIVQFKPLSEKNIDKAILFARKFLVAAGEDAREVENKIDSGRAGYEEGSDGVEIKFAEGTYVRFSVWSGGNQDRAGVVIEPD